MALDDFEELLADQPEDERWELIGGRVVRMMVGARWEHGRIVSNLHYELRRRFAAAGSPCRVFAETFRVKAEDAMSSLLPDIVVACRPLPPGATSFGDPTVLIEVLSDGTARRDRVEKWAAYQTLPSLRHYALVERDKPHIEIFDRRGEGWHGLRIADGLGASFDLPAHDVSIPLTEVYADLFG